MVEVTVVVGGGCFYLSVIRRWFVAATTVTVR
jgi:hypothetical protein